MDGQVQTAHPLRQDVLAGRAVVCAGPEAEGRIADLCVTLGAAVTRFACPTLPAEDAVAARVAELSLECVDALVVDAGAGFAQLGDEAATSGLEALRVGLDGAWAVTRALGEAYLIPGSESSTIVYLAPRPDAGPHAEAARAGVENLARTLSIEWARHGVRPVAILPGAQTADEDVQRLVAYLVSPAGAYFAGCCFRLGEAVPAVPGEAVTR